MKSILIVAFEFRPQIGGVASCGFGLAKGLQELGIRVEVVSAHVLGCEEFDAVQNFPIVRVRLPKSAALALLPFSFAVAKILKRRKPEAIVAMLWLPCGLAALLGRFLSRSKAVLGIYAHGVELMESRRNFKKWLRGRLSVFKALAFQRADRAMAVSQFTANLLHAETSVAKEKIRLVYNGVEGRFVNSDLSSRDQAHTGLRLLTVTRLVPNKGVDQVLAAIGLLKKAGLSVFYTVVGQGPDLPRLKSLAEQHGLQDEVLFVTPNSDSDVLKAYSMADVFILASREDRRLPAVEGFGIVFLEAGSHGLPVIGGRSGGIPDAIEEGVTGLLVDPEDPRNIAEKITSLAKDAALRSRLGEAGRKRTLTRFTWRNTAERVVGAFR